MMNYIAELKAFYDRLELDPQPNTAIALWHALMFIANKAGWPDTFTAAQSVLGLRSGLNASALKRARNQLATSGLIEWKPRGGNQSAQYRIISLAVQNQYRNEPQSAPQSAPQSEPQRAPQSEPQSDPINKHKQKHKHKQDIPPISPVSFGRFLAAYPMEHKQINHHLAEKAYTDCLLKRNVTEQELLTAAVNYADKCTRMHTDACFVKKPENFLRDLEYCQYLTEVYVPPVLKTADKGMLCHNYGDMDALEKELTEN